MIDLEALLQAIAPDNPCGPDLRGVSGDPTLAKANDLRQEIDAELDPAGRGKSADWAGLVKLCAEALASRSKDLQLAAYLAEGLARTQGFPGLIAGLRLVRGLVERHWEGLHPGCEDGEIVLPVRARWLTWLGGSGEFLASVKRIPLTAALGERAHCWFDFEQSKRVDEASRKSDTQRRDELLAAGLITGEQWRQALRATPPAALGATVAAIDEALEEIAALKSVSDERFGDEAPLFVELDNLLADCRDHLRRAQAAEESQDEAAAGAAGPAGAGFQGPGLAATGGGAGAAGGPGGPIASRDHAYRILREVADYLRRVEPHSPAPLLIDRAVKWGGMSFEDLLQDVVKHGDVRAQVRELLGLPPDLGE